MQAEAKRHESKRRLLFALLSGGGFLGEHDGKIYIIYKTKKDAFPKDNVCGVPSAVAGYGGVRLGYGHSVNALEKAARSGMASRRRV